MGYFWFGLPDFIQAFVLDVLGPETAFVETGTFEGETALQASRSFARVDTIELDPGYYHAAVAKLAGSPATCHLGDSRDVLPKLLPEDSRGLLVWLDAHYSGGATAGADDPCPIFGELEVLLPRRKPDNTIVAMDDARLFTGLDGYPRLDQVAAVLEAGWSWAIIDDVIVATSAENLALLMARSTQSRQLQSGSLGRYWPVIRGLQSLNKSRNRVKIAVSKRR
jgi:hypothetical protein